MEKTHSSKDNSKGKVHAIKVKDLSDKGIITKDPEGKFGPEDEIPEEEETPSQIRQRLYTEFRGKLEKLAGELNSASSQLQGGGSQRLQRIAKDMTRSAKILK